MFHVFAGAECYYASGGANDFVKSFPSFGEALIFAMKLESAEKVEWWQVTNDRMEILKTSSATPHNSESGLATCKVQILLLSEYIEIVKHREGEDLYIHNSGEIRNLEEGSFWLERPNNGWTLLSSLPQERLADLLKEDPEIVVIE